MSVCCCALSADSSASQGRRVHKNFKSMAGKRFLSLLLWMDLQENLTLDYLLLDHHTWLFKTWQDPLPSISTLGYSLLGGPKWYSKQEKYESATKPP